jgi:hypothetical protein
MDEQHTSADVPAVPNGLEAFRTQGIRRNRKKEFNLSLTGEEIYQTLKILEGLAVKTAAQGDRYMDVRECVLAAECIRNEARRQGF